MPASPSVSGACLGSHAAPALRSPPTRRPQEVVVGFHKAPKRWWDACTSEKGKQNLFK